MRITRFFTLLGMLVMLALVSQGAVAQDDKDEAKPEQAAQDKKTEVKKSLNVYRLDFVLSEFLDGKKVNARSYSVVVRENQQMNRLRALAKVPVVTSSQKTASGMSVPTQVQYHDIGVNIDCRVMGRDGYLELNAIVESNSVSTAEGAEWLTASGEPVINHMTSDINSLIRPGIPTMVSSIDDPASKRRFQVDVTATKMN